MNELKNEEQWGLEETFKTLGIALLCILFQSKLTFFAKNIDEKYILMPGALGRPRGMEWGGRREEGSGWGTHVYLWWIHFDIWQN